MTIYYPVEAGGLASPIRPRDAGALRHKVVIRKTWNMTAQTTSDTLEGMTLPRGFRVDRWKIVPSATLGSTTLALGITGTAGKYRAAATVTAPTSGDSVTAPPSGGLAADEALLITIAAATMPASGTVAVEFEGTFE